VTDADEQDWRLKVVMEDGGRGPWSANKLEARSLAGDAHRELGERVAVSRDGGELFVYAGDAAAAHAAERVVRADLEEHGWHAEVELARWHEAAGDWEPADRPLPDDAAERSSEHERLIAREDAGDGVDWEVRAEVPTRAAARELSARLEGEGLGPVRRWRYVFVGAADEDAGRALAERIEREGPPGTTAAAEATFESIERNNPFAVFGAGTGEP
jgi:hypothetical protein